MLITFRKEQISCRGGFFEEIKAIGVEKMHQIQTKNTKKINFSKILCSFCVILESLGGSIIKDVQQGTNWFFKKINEVL